jgi:hypothetical protein
VIHQLVLVLAFSEERSKLATFSTTQIFKHTEKLLRLPVSISFYHLKCKLKHLFLMLDVFMHFNCSYLVQFYVFCQGLNPSFVVLRIYKLLRWKRLPDNFLFIYFYCFYIYTYMYTLFGPATSLPCPPISFLLPSHHPTPLQIQVEPVLPSCAPR